MAYNVGATNATSPAYPKDPSNIEPTWQPKPRSCNLMNKISIYKVNNKGGQHRTLTYSVANTEIVR